MKKGNDLNKTNQESGFALLDVLVAITIFALLLPGIISFIQMTSQSTNKKVAATQLKRIATAAKEYVKNNHSTIVSSATASNSYNFTLSDLRTDGYLDSGYNNRNPWNQAYNFYVFNPQDDDVHLVITTSGGRGGGNTEFENKVVPSTAAMLGADGGFVPTGNMPGENSNTIQGAYGGWQFPLSGTDISNPGAGHLAYSRYMDQDQVGNDYLYRNAVPGKPELNTMTTELDMDGNTIQMGDGNVGGGDGEGVRKVNFENHEASDFVCADNDDYGGSVFYDRSDGLYVCREGEKVKIADEGNEGFMQDAQIVADNTNIAKPNCLGGTTPQVFVAPVAFSEDTTGGSIKSVQAYAENHPTNSNFWKVHLRLLTSDGWMNPGPNYGKVMVITKCSS